MRAGRQGLPALFLVACVLLAACSRRDDAAANGPTAPSTPTAGGGSFSILAGSELKEMAPALTQAALAAGVSLQLSYAGTLDIVERINGGERFDAILPPNGAYPTLALAQPPVARDKLFYSRVALGVKPDKARQLGWDRQPPTWADIARAASTGKLRYAMANPTASNTGMSALFAVASAAAGKTEDLRADEVDTPTIKAFLAGQSLTAGSSGWLAEAFGQDAGTLDAMVNYESVLLQANARRAPADALQLIYPRDGVISADYPLMLLNAARRADYDKLVQAYKATPFQREAVAAAFLRPSNPEASANAALPTQAVSELAFPNNLQVIDEVLSAYQSEWRRPTTSILVLDVSSSMYGKRLEGMRDALLMLAGADSSRASARYARFQAREKVALITFSDKVASPRWVRFEGARAEAGHAEVRSFASAMKADGRTAVYSALDAAERLARDEARQEPGRFISILLLTDGESNSGLRYDEFKRRWSGPGPVRVFPILFGEGNVREMDGVAQLTGGRTFDARKTALTQVFKEIRGYQ
ncbi:VWA domain-containing protein [Ideonella sp. DXS29W]|uniref:VWA domain-containing protein n=1 Tax=Ideonella lacteola TaxID=2984193 RepID=A0ABU9BSD9_9BURK